MNERKLELLSAALRTLGGNFDVPTLELIFLVAEEVERNGENISIADVRNISKQVAEKYQPKQPVAQP